MVKILINKEKIKEFKILFHLIILLLFPHIIKSEDIQCPRDKPIFKSGNCVLDYCADSSECKVTNPIIKTQWLNNIRKIGDSTYKYISFASFSNGDMIIETTCHPKLAKRMFYGIKANGRPYFTTKDPKNEETPYYSKDSNALYGQFEFESLVIKKSLDEEYFLSVSRGECNAEIFDFEKDIMYTKEVNRFTSIISTKTKRHAIIPLKNEGEKYYYLIAFKGCNYSNCNDDKIYFQKHNFLQIENFALINTYISNDANFVNKENAYGEIVSCFQTDNELIICFYLTKDNNIVHYNIIKYDNDLTNDQVKTYESNIDDSSLFYKCIHLKGEVGIFASYYNSGNNYPTFLFLEYDSTIPSFKDYLSTPRSTIILQKPGFNYNVLLNDIIKINENKIIFSAPLENKEVLYIVVLHIFEEKKIKIRYYSIEIYALYHHKLLSDLRIHNYNNFLALGFSYCPSNICIEDDNNIHYSALIIFSYPNSIDKLLKVEDYLLSNNNVDIKNLEIDLKTQLNLENNIFGYIVSNIKIYRITGPPPDYKAYSSKYESKEIIDNTILEEDENIIFKYIGNENHLKILDKKIEYNFIVTEPDYNIYETFINKTEGDNDINYFKKGEYVGKYSYYNIKSEKEFGIVCDGNPNCNACIRNTPSYCYSCKYISSLSGENGKTCYEKGTDKITETPTTEAMTETPTTITITETPTTITITETPTKEAITEKIPETEENKNDIECSNQDILINKCSSGSIKDEQLGKLYNDVKINYLNSNVTNTVIKTENVVFQISTLDEQKNSDNSDVSSIDLGDCEKELKKSMAYPMNYL